jgi:hypothetical protein
MNANLVITRDYGENSQFWLEKNKAKTNPIAGLWPEIRNKMSLFFLDTHREALKRFWGRCMGQIKQ